MGITGFGVTNLKLALPIAIRYSGVRRQFGPKGGEEIPVLEYQLQVQKLRVEEFMSEMKKISISFHKMIFLSYIQALFFFE